MSLDPAPSTSSPILCVGELLWDMLPSGPRLGGATTNFAVLIAKLGDAAILVSRIGRDALGRSALEDLSASNSADGQALLDLSRVQRSPDLPTGTVGVTLDSQGKPAYIIEEPVAWDEIALDPGLIDRARSASAVYFGTLAQRREPSRGSLQALVEATLPGCVRICDMNLRMPFCTVDVLQWCLQHATVLKVSDEELPLIFDLLGWPLSLEDPREPSCASQPHLPVQPRHAAAALLRNAPGCALVAITLGPHGSYLANRQEEHRHPGFPISVVDTIGAGDAFTAGMIHAYLRGGTLEQINTVSNLCGSYVASQPGATPEFSSKLLQQLRSIVGD